MKLNQAGLDIIKRFEGLSLTAYRCPAGVLTIGHGHTRDPYSGKLDVRPGMTITAHQAEVLLEVDLERFDEGVEKLAPTATANQHSAMVSLAFNIGLNAFENSTVLRKFSAGDLQGAAVAFLAWRMGGGKVLPGLVKRREAERELFLRP